MQKSVAIQSCHPVHTRSSQQVRTHGSNIFPENKTTSNDLAIKYFKQMKWEIAV